MKANIERRFFDNISRVKNLVDIYEDNLSGNGPGRRGHAKTDVLRAATVLLHASVEDLLRSLAYWKLPNATAGVLDKIPLISVAPSIKFSLGSLAVHRGQSIDDVITASVNGYLERSNYNNTDEVSTLLTNIGVDPQRVNERFTSLSILMNRRHLIVHRADLDEQGGRGNHRVKSIGTKSVRGWIETAEIFGATVLNEIIE